MPTLHFTSALARHLDCPASIEARGESVREVLDDGLRDHARLRSYILDDQGELRKHMQIFVDGTLLEDRHGQTDPVESSSEIYILQALSGG